MKDHTNATATATVPPPRSRGGWLRKLTWLAAAALLLVVAAYFIATSNAFFQGVVLPRVSQTLAAQVTVREAVIRPFSEVVLRDLKVHPDGVEPLLTAKELRARYRLLDLVRGHIKLAEVALESPTVQLIQQADGRSNLDPILKALASEPAAPPAPASPESAQPLAVDLQKLAVNQASLSFAQTDTSGATQLAKVSDLNLALANLKNGQTARLTLAAKLDYSTTSGTNAAALAATLKGDFTAALTPDLQPSQVKGQTEWAVGDATGAFADAARLNAKLIADLSLTEIGQLTVNFTRAGALLGNLAVSGPFDLLQQEGKLSVAVGGIGSEVLGLVGGPYDLAFGQTKLAARADLELKNQAQFISTVGSVTGNAFSLTRAGLTTPTLDLKFDYDLTADLAQTNARVRQFALHATQNGQPLLQAALARELQIDWGKANDAIPDSNLDVALTQLDLAQWQAFLGTNLTAGVLNGKLGLAVQKAGQLIAFDLASELTNVAAQFDTNRFADLGVTLAARGQATDLDKVELAGLTVLATHAGQTVATASAAGTYNTTTADANLQTQLELALARVAALATAPDLQVTDGTVKFTGRVLQRNPTPAQTNNVALDQEITGDLQLANLTGTLAGTRFDRFASTFALDALLKNQVAHIRKLSGALQHADQPGGRFDVTGNYDLTNQVGQLSLKLSDLNQAALAPLLAPMLGTATLKSVSINADTAAQYDAKGASSLKALLQVTNLVVHDPAGALPQTPQAAQLQLDASLANQLLDLRQAQLALTPTPRAQNQLDLSGKLDLTQSNTISGNLKLSAQALDLTAYYDLYAGTGAPAGSTTTPAPAPTPPPPAAPSASPDAEAPAMTLPLRRFTFATSIGQFYLRELAITNLQAETRIDGGTVALDPLRFSLNGAPATGKVNLDLGVPGYAYAMDAQATQVPLAPLVNSFQPDRKGQMAGTLDALVRLQGAGTTGANLQKNLSGQFDIGTTNLNLKLVDVRSSLLKSVINVIIGLPDIIRNPSGALGTIVGRLAGEGASESGGGWIDQVSKSPIDSIVVRGKAGAGRADLEHALVQSPAFQVQTQGAVQWAAILTNSPIDFPVALALRQSLAEKIGQVPEGTPTNLAYVNLPDFLTIKGTLGNPERKYNLVALARMGSKMATGILGESGLAAGEKVTGVLEKVGGVLGGRPAGANTNAPAAQPSVQGILDKLLPPGQPPAPAGTNQPPDTKKRGLFDLLK